MLRSLFALLLLVLPVAAHADWYEAGSAHFLVYSDHDPDRLKDFATQLERFDGAIRALLGRSDAPVSKAERVVVYLVDGQADMRRLNDGRGVAGYYAPTVDPFAVVPEAWGEGHALDIRPTEVLLHEYSHHLMFSLSPNAVYPAWLVEGFAEFNATAKFGKDGSVTLGNPPLYRGVRLLEGNAMPVDQLLTADLARLDGLDRDRMYAKGWLLTHYLRIGAPARQGQLPAYLAALNAGKSPADAARAFGDLKQLDRELERYKMGRFNISTVPAAQIRIGTVEVRKLSAGAAATMDVRIASAARRYSGAKAADILADARRAAAPWPNDAAAQLVLAQAAIDADDYAGAEAAADRAIAADPQAARGYVWKARARMALAGKAGARDPATWNAIRALLGKANHADPQDPVPLFHYYDSYLDQGVAPSEIAKDGLNSAFLLAPQDVRLRLLTATMYLRERNGGAARALLAPLAYDPHETGTPQRARASIERIDAGDLDGAIAALRPAPKKAGS